ELPPSVELTVTELFLAPAVVPVTFTLKLTLAPAAREPPERLTVPEPAVAVTVPPPRLPLTSVNPLGVETTKPAGRLSVNDRTVRAVPALGLVMVKVSVVEPFRGMVAAPNDSEALTGATTVTLALAGAELPPSVE